MRTVHVVPVAPEVAEAIRAARPKLKRMGSVKHLPTLVEKARVRRIVPSTACEPTGIRIDLNQRELGKTEDLPWVRKSQRQIVRGSGTETPRARTVRTPKHGPMVTVGVHAREWDIALPSGKTVIAVKPASEHQVRAGTVIATDAGAYWIAVGRELKSPFYRPLDEHDAWRIRDGWLYLGTPVVAKGVCTSHGKGGHLTETRWYIGGSWKREPIADPETKWMDVEFDVGGTTSLHGSCEEQAVRKVRTEIKRPVWRGTRFHGIDQGPRTEFHIVAVGQVASKDRTAKRSILLVHKKNRREQHREILRWYSDHGVIPDGELEHRLIGIQQRIHSLAPLTEEELAVTHDRPVPLAGKFWDRTPASYKRAYWQVLDEFGVETQITDSREFDLGDDYFNTEPRPRKTRKSSHRSAKVKEVVRISE